MDITMLESSNANTAIIAISMENHGFSISLGLGFPTFSGKTNET